MEKPTLLCLPIPWLLCFVNRDFVICKVEYRGKRNNAKYALSSLHSLPHQDCYYCDCWFVRNPLKIFAASSGL